MLRKSMTKIRITPFLVLNPCIALWALYQLLTLEGFAVIISGFFITVIVASAVLLVIDRLIAREINLLTVFVIEIIVLVLSYKLAEWYLY